MSRLNPDDCGDIAGEPVRPATEPEKCPSCGSPNKKFVYCTNFVGGHCSDAWHEGELCKTTECPQCGCDMVDGKCRVQPWHSESKSAVPDAAECPTCKAVGGLCFAHENAREVEQRIPAPCNIHHEEFVPGCDGCDAERRFAFNPRPATGEGLCPTCGEELRCTNEGCGLPKADHFEGGFCNEETENKFTSSVAVPDAAARLAEKIRAYFDECYDTTIPGKTFDEGLIALIREAGENAPFGWWDSFNEVLYRSKNDAKLATDGGNKVIPLYAGEAGEMRPRRTHHDFKTIRHKSEIASPAVPPKLGAEEFYKFGKAHFPNVFAFAEAYAQHVAAGEMRDDLEKDLRGMIADWRQTAHNRQERAEKAESEALKLREALRTAKVRLEICLGRMRACAEDPQNHEVSLGEIPAWIEEMSGLLAGEKVRE